ncbi:MAG: hypothetical protein ACK5HR_05640 [Mycoplasmatales bacterium]
MLKVFVQDDCITCQSFKNLLNKSVDLDYELINKEDGNEEMFEKYNILTSPTTILVDNSNEEVARFYGIKEIIQIKDFIEGAY